MTVYQTSHETEENENGNGELLYHTSCIGEGCDMMWLRYDAVVKII